MNLDDSEKGSGREVSIGHRNWLLTFGDLLTLLLCFFLAIVSFSPLNPSPERAEYVKKSAAYDANSQSSSKTGRSLTHGTTLAHVEGKASGVITRPGVEEYWFVEDDFSNRVTDISANKAEEFKSSVASTDYSAKQVEIETCNPLAPPSDEIHRAVPGLRAIALSRQVIDAVKGASFANLKLMEYRESCGRINSEDSPHKVALVRIFWNSKNG